MTLRRILVPLLLLTAACKVQQPLEVVEPPVAAPVQDPGLVPGRVTLQTMPLANFVDLIARSLPTNNNGSSNN